jgi:RNA polymerase II subunit A-like phosphatase
MVVVIDDRSDVWGHIPNVVKVIPCAYKYMESSVDRSLLFLKIDNFFGIGDINAAGLPKQPDSMLTPAPTAPPNASKSDTFPASRTAFTSKTEADGASSEAEKAAQAIAEAKTKVIEALVEERPLAKMQEKLDSADESKEASSSRLAPSSSGSNGEVKHKHKALLRNDDTELDRVQKVGKCSIISINRQN